MYSLVELFGSGFHAIVLSSMIRAIMATAWSQIAIIYRSYTQLEGQMKQLSKNTISEMEVTVPLCGLGRSTACLESSSSSPVVL